MCFAATKLGARGSDGGVHHAYKGNDLELLPARSMAAASLATACSRSLVDKSRASKIEVHVKMLVLINFANYSG